MTRAGFDVKQRLPVPLVEYPKLEVEIRGSVAVPMLTQRYSILQPQLRGGAAAGSGAGSGAGAGGTQPLHFHLAQTNLIVRF